MESKIQISKSKEDIRSNQREKTQYLHEIIIRLVTAILHIKTGSQKSMEDL